MKNYDKDFRMVEDGYFVLVSNQDKSPKEILDDYYCRIEIEKVFKTSKEYLKLLPIKKWNNEAVRGKILTDMISSIVYILMRKTLKENSKASIPEIIGATQSLMCFKDKNDILTVETPNKKVKDYYKYMGIALPSTVDLNEYKKSMGISSAKM